MALTIAILGASGAVGRAMLGVLERSALDIGEVRALASARSAGTSLPFAGRQLDVAKVSDEAFDGVDIALFSAGSGTSREWAERAAAHGAVVVDNSSAWRMHDAVPLVVPEVNPHAIAERPKGIIANPNCSTIALVVALKPLHDESRIRRAVVSTYQAISGGGASAVENFRAQQRAVASGEKAETTDLSGQLADNLLMHWSPDAHGAYQQEELKLVHETRKILGDEEIRVSPTCVRVPVVTSHSLSVALELDEPMSPDRARELLARAPGVTVLDDFGAGKYPQPLVSTGQDDVFVGRIREDVGNPGGLLLWVVGDNLLKGAALNAVQIAERVGAA